MRDRPICPCGQPVATRENRWCSRACSALARRTLPTLKCAQCGAEFRRAKPSGKMPKYCSQVCYGRSLERPERRPPCAICGEPCASSRSKYCSRECQGAAKRVAAPKWTHPSQIEVRRAYFRAWAERNRLRVRARSLEWKRAHPETARQCEARYSAKRRSQIGKAGKITAAEWTALVASFGYRCLRCGRQPPAITLSMDHVVPLAKGGLHEIGNIQPLCRSCNSRKHTTIVDYRDSIVPDLTKHGRDDLVIGTAVPD